MNSLSWSAFRCICRCCQGDSGSPLICRTGPDGGYEVAGIVSAGKGCGTGTYPGIYTRAAHYHDWIQGVISENSDA